MKLDFNVGFCSPIFILDCATTLDFDFFQQLKNTFRVMDSGLGC